MTGSATASYQLFLKDLSNNNSFDTRRVYVERFNDFLQMSHIANTDHLVSMEPRDFEDRAKAYIDSRLSNGHKTSYSFLNQVVSAIRKFCLANRINLNFAWIYSQIPKPDSAAYPAQELNEQEPYSTDQVDRMLQSAKGKRAEPAITIMAKGGARVGALRTLQIDPPYCQFIEAYKCLALQAYPKTKYAYWIILPPKASELILTYKGKRTKGRLFINGDNEPIGRNSISGDVYKVAVKSKVRKPFKGDNMHRHKTMLDHGLRKWHQTQLEKAGLKDDHIARLRGERRGLKSVYQLPTPAEIIALTEFSKAIPILDSI